MLAIVNRGRLPIKSLLGAFALCLGAGAVVPAHALDLTASNSNGFVNDGVFFQQTAGTGSGGTGNLSPFLRIQGGNQDSVEQGFNSDARPESFNEDNNAALNRDLLAAEIPIVNIGGIDYGEILLDLNENNSSAGSLINLTALRIFQHSISDITNGITGNDFNAFSGQSVTEIFTLGETVNLSDLESGSGSIDYAINIPVSLFDLTNGEYVTFYAAFDDFDGGFEEFAVATGDNLETIPTPAMLPALVGMGVAAFRKRKQHRQEQGA